MPDPDPTLDEVEKRLQALQQQVQDLRSLERLESLPLVQLQALNQDLDALEARLHQYLVQRTQPSLFWQVVRFVGLGIAIGMAAQAWLQR